jgi:two-component system, NtrC family, response regulator AlgB
VIGFCAVHLGGCHYSHELCGDLPGIRSNPIAQIPSPSVTNAIIGLALQHKRTMETGWPMAEKLDCTAPLNVLVVDDEPNIRKSLSIFLESHGHRVVTVPTFRDAVAVASRRAFDIALVDLRLGNDDGLDLIPILLASIPWINIIVITAYASIESAVEAMRRGAFDYLPKPFTPDQVRLALDKAAKVRVLEHRVANLQDELSLSKPEVLFSSSNLAMHRAVSIAREVAVSDATILLRGESGTGKTELGRKIHSWSPRAHKPLGVVSCPALSPELLESELFGHVKGAFTGALKDTVGRIAASEGGSLLLDEIGDLPLTVQPKLLRFLQDREYERVGDTRTRQADVRIIAATNTDLEEAVRDRRFREDLFYRLNVIQIEIPPLRERIEDVAPLAESLLLFFGAKNHRRFTGFTDEAVEILERHQWPGNVRELRNTIERAAILCRSHEVGKEYLLDRIGADKQALALGDLAPLAQVEEEHIRKVLERTTSLQEAAQVLGIDQATLWRRRKQYQI